MLTQVLAFPRLRLLMTEGLRLPSFQSRMPERRHLLSSMVLATTAALYLVAGLSVVGIEDNEGRAVARASAQVPSVSSIIAGRAASPSVAPQQLRDIDPRDAVSVNASIPIAALPNPAARPFALTAGGENAVRAVECLTTAIYYEAAIEPLEGQRAVAQVILNRVRHPAFPKSVCGVVFQGSTRSTGCQFSFTCDGSLGRVPSAAGWRRAREVAQAALAGQVYAPVGYATHYHTNWVVPYWASSLVKAANVGTHIFYRWTGGWGMPGAFRGRYTGVEPSTALMNRLTELPPVPVTVDAQDAAAAVAAIEGSSGSASIDSFQRAVVRRYEPLSRTSAATANAAMVRPEDSSAYRWAITGQGAPAGEPLGRRSEPATTPAPACAEGATCPEARPGAPRELAGVRRRAEPTQ